MKNTKPSSLVSLEKQLADFLGVKYTVLTGSGRSALAIALRSLEIGNGNVIIPDLTCAIVPQTIISAGLKPVLVDVNKDLSLDLESVENRLDPATRAIVVNHLYGCPADDMRRILSIARQKGLFVIEDAVQSFGATLNNRYVGTFGDIGVLGFAKCFFNLLRGGAIITNDAALASNARRSQAQILRRANPLELRFRYFRRAAPNFIKRLYSILHGETTSPEPPPDGLYRRWEVTYPYQCQHLTSFEASSILQTLPALGRLKAGRVALAEEILKIVQARPDIGLELLLPHRPDFTYTRIPVIIRHSTLDKWVSYFRRRGIVIDMYYFPLSDNLLLREHSLLSGDYPVSHALARSLLPLPVSAEMVRVLKSLNVTRDIP
ncbi:MAG: aminotransferase class V-fold PLP-dependent enzyme [Dehalococcoidales bacterium]|nr:aminotransferase class V-fold PLP-dependent enzyme [Dehalococcoidales bacterium]